MRVLVSGARGFIGSNLVAQLTQRQDLELQTFTHDDELGLLRSHIATTDFIFHMAGVNRPKDSSEFQIGNVDLTRELCAAAALADRRIPILYASSSQVSLNNPYGASKRAAEQALCELATTHTVPVYIFRLPNVFGRWARPNYNSVVATFCHNIARNLPIQINDPAAVISLVYIDDVVKQFLAVMDSGSQAGQFLKVQPEYATTVGDLADQLQAFQDGYNPLLAGSQDSLAVSLYHTYLSYLP